METAARTKYLHTLSNITTRGAVSTGNATARLLLNGDAELSADNTTTAQLSGPGGDTLITKYRLTFDGNGLGATGAGEVGYASYESFLNTPVLITHVGGDDDVQVTLYARAEHDAGNVANAGAYSATQTLTVSWVGP